jgi:hypothetical protein
MTPEIVAKNIIVSFCVGCEMPFSASHALYSFAPSWRLLLFSDSHASAIGSISDGSLFLTLPTRVLTGHIFMSSAA